MSEIGPNIKNGTQDTKNNVQTPSQALNQPARIQIGKKPSVDLAQETTNTQFRIYQSS